MSARRSQSAAEQRPAPLSAPPAAVPPAHSLMARTSAILALGLVLAAVALVLLFRPYLAAEFEAESGELLRDQARRATSAARADASATVLLVRSASRASLDAAENTLRDLPLELVTSDADAVRGVADEQLTVLRGESARNLDVLAEEIRQATESRLVEDESRVAERNQRSAESFGRTISMRVAALLMALLAALFLLHGLLLYRTVLAPVRRLGAATRAVAQGKFGTRLEVKGDDEVAQLALSFNRMTINLEEVHLALATLNADLEDRVRTKTTELRSALDESREANRRLERAMQELRDKERELRQAEKMASLGTLAGGVAHEFNNLLGGILGCAEEAGREEDTDELRETLRMIERTARRGTAITGNLLRFARPGTGSSVDVDADALIHDVADLIGPEATRLGVEVRVACTGDTRVHAEPSGMHQVLLNLATNALYAMRGRGGVLTLSATSDDDKVTLCVSDTGHGIPADVRERLFEPFFTTRGPEGTGLGLSVTYGIIRAHGGRIDIDSEPGQGATFRIELPRGRRRAPGGAT